MDEDHARLIDAKVEFPPATSVAATVFRGGLSRRCAARKTSGCELIFRDTASGGRWDRPELHTLLSQLRKGAVVVVWTLDRLSRSLRDVLTSMERVQERHAGFRSRKEAVDTTTPAGGKYAWLAPVHLPIPSTHGRRGRFLAVIGREN